MLKLEQPFLDGATCSGGGNRLQKHNFLIRPTDHVCDVELGGELESVDALEALLQMRLHTGWVLGFAQNLEHFVVGKEEKASKEETFLLEIVVETLENGLELRVRRLQCLQDAWRG
jgi:hypothetical protein